MKHPRTNWPEAIDQQHRQFRRSLRQWPDESPGLTVDAAYVEFVKAHPKRSVA